MASEDLLQAEARERPRMAIVAGVAAVFTLAAPIVGLVVLKNAPDNVLASALQRQRHLTGLGLSTACSVIGLLAIAAVLDFLYRATRARNPQVPPLLRPLPWAGGVGLAIVLVALQVVTATKLNHFATHGSQTYDEAKAVTDYGVGSYLGIVVQLAFSLAFVMISVNAMRVGLLTRFLGYLGVISAVLFVLPLVPIPIVQVYWLGMMAMVFAGRAPNGMPAAWDGGEAVPWPSTGELREARVRAAEARRGGGGEPEAAVESPAAAAAASSRRKRKKRR